MERGYGECRIRIQLSVSFCESAQRAESECALFRLRPSEQEQSGCEREKILETMISMDRDGEGTWGVQDSNWVVHVVL